MAGNKQKKKTDKKSSKKSSKKSAASSSPDLQLLLPILLQLLQSQIGGQSQLPTQNQSPLPGGPLPSIPGLGGM